MRESWNYAQSQYQYQLVRRYERMGAIMKYRPVSMHSAFQRAYYICKMSLKRVVVEADKNALSPLLCCMQGPCYARCGAGSGSGCQDAGHLCRYAPGGLALPAFMPLSALYLPVQQQPLHGFIFRSLSLGAENFEMRSAALRY
jgi:hypothetical protein